MALWVIKCYILLKPLALSQRDPFGAGTPPPFRLHVAIASATGHGQALRKGDFFNSSLLKGGGRAIARSEGCEILNAICYELRVA